MFGKLWCFFFLSISSIFGQNISSTLLDEEDSETSTKPRNLFPMQLEPFSRLGHGVSSGPISVLDERTFFISDLHYDGKGPDAHFWVGKGPAPDAQGTLVPDENNSTATLSAYDGQNVTVRLPHNLTIDQIDYFALWCIEFNQNFGFTKTKRSDFGVQLEAFQQLAHGLRSGPIVAVDKQTFFIPNLHYDGKGPDAHFWVGNGSEPSPYGILIPDENHSMQPLQKYTGQNVYVRLTGDLTLEKIDYFAVWCIEYKHNFGHITIPKGLKLEEPSADPHFTPDSKEIIRVQKCCPLDEILSISGCEKGQSHFRPNVDVHRHNSTHIDDVPILASSLTFIPFVNRINCLYQQYPLLPDEDTFVLLENGTLIVLNTGQVLSEDNYCMETVNFGDEKNEEWVTTAILCFTSGEAPLSSAIFIIYAVGILISASFLILTAVVFLVVKEVRDARGKCVIFYSTSMAATFICLASAQFSGIDENTCTVVGLILQFFLVSSFTWLTLVSWETYCKIRNYNNDYYTDDRKRLYIYLGCGIVIPVITTGISLMVDRMPSIPETILKPQFGKNSCWFDQQRGTHLYFYIPVGIAIVFNMVLLIFMGLKLAKLQKTKATDPSWLITKQDLKPMFRSCTFLLTVMTVCWVMEILSYATRGEGGVWVAIDIVNSLQGLIVFLIFVIHRPVKDKIADFSKQICATQAPDEEGTEMTRLNGNHSTDNAGENRQSVNYNFLTKLERVESTEHLS